MPSDDDAVAAPPRDEEKNNEKEKSGTANDEANTADAASSPSDDADARAATSTTENTLESVMAALQTPPDRRSEAEADCIYSIVSQAGWFASVPALAARQVALQASLVRIDPKTELEREGELSTVFYVILFGTCSVYRRASGRRRRYISAIGRGATVGEPVLDVVEVRSASSVISESMCSLIAIDRKRLTVCRQSALAALQRPHGERGAEDVQNILTAIRAISFFRQLTFEAQATLASTVGLLRVNHGDVICRQGDEGNTMYVLLTGAVEVRVSDGTGPGKGKQRIVGQLAAGDSFGEHALVEAASNSRRNATCICDCENGADLITISRPIFEAVLKNNDAVVFHPSQARARLEVPPGERSDRDVVMIMDMVKGHAYFRDLEEEVRTILAKVMTLEVVETGQVVFEQGTRGDCLYVVLEGTCREYVRGESAAAADTANAGGRQHRRFRNAVSRIRPQTASWLSSTTGAPSSSASASASASASGSTTSSSQRPRSASPSFRKAIASVTSTSSRSRQEGGMMQVVKAAKAAAAASQGARRGSVAGSPSRRVARRASVAEEIGVELAETKERARALVSRLARRKSLPNVASIAAAAYAVAAAADSAAADQQSSSTYGELTAKYTTGDSFGEHALSHPSSRRSATVVAGSRLELLVISRYTYERFIQRRSHEAWSEHLAFFAGVPILEGMRTNELLNLLYLLTARRLGKGERVLNEGDVVENLFFCRSGGVTLTARCSGTEMPLVTLGPGEFFGEEAVTRADRRMRVGAIATSSTTQLFILRIADLTRLPASVRENVVRTAGLRRAWRCEQRRRLRRISTIPSKSQFENATTMSRPGAVSPLAKRTPTAKTHKSGDGIDEAATQSSLLNDVVNCSWMLRPLSARHRQQQQQQQQQQEQPSLSIAPEIAAPDVDMDIQEDDDETETSDCDEHGRDTKGTKGAEESRENLDSSNDIVAGEMEDDPYVTPAAPTPPRSASRAPKVVVSKRPGSSVSRRLYSAGKGGGGGARGGANMVRTMPPKLGMYTQRQTEVNVLSFSATGRLHL